LELSPTEKANISHTGITYIIHWVIFQNELDYWGWSEAGDPAPELSAYGTKMGFRVSDGLVFRISAML
jgi:hypothetical protein